MAHFWIQSWGTVTPSTRYFSKVHFRTDVYLKVNCNEEPHANADQDTKKKTFDREIHSFERKLQYFWNTRIWILEWIQRQLSLSNGFYSSPFNSGDQSIVLSTQATRYTEPKIILSEACIKIWRGTECSTQVLDQDNLKNSIAKLSKASHIFSIKNSFRNFHTESSGLAWQILNCSS